MAEFNLLLISTIYSLPAVVGSHIQRVLQYTWQSIEGLGAIAIVAFILLYIIATVALIPGSILTLSAGMIFGVGWGSVYVLVGAICGETCAFLLGRYFLRNWINSRIEHNATFFALNQALNREGLKIILLTRLSPIS